ncbi:pyranose dehydrogenase 3 [Russula decolorans]
MSVSCLVKFLSAAFLLISPSSAALLTDPSQLKTNYNFIVIGAGTAGNVIASRLTEDPHVSVLVLEAGISNEGVLASQIPLLAPTLTPYTLYDWNYTTTAQPGFNGRSIPYPRGRLLGGSSSVNYQTYVHGSVDDFDRYASHTGDQGWNWNNMQKYIQKNEKLVAPADHHNTSGQFTPSVHGFHGAVDVSLPGFPTPLDKRVIASTQETANFPFNQDMNSGDVLGIGWQQATIGRGTRSSSATAYLAPALRRPKLDVLINAQVTKLVQSGTRNGNPCFHTVEFAAKEGGKYISLHSTISQNTILTWRSSHYTAPLNYVHATKEVILSAGSVGTPIILLHSGIGDRTDLEALSIQSTVHNPSVGRNLSDHVLLSNVYTVNSNQTYDPIFRDSAVRDKLIAQWEATKNGPLAGGVTNQIGWLRLPQNASIFKTVKDPSAGPRSSHWEIIFLNMFLNPGTTTPASGNFMSILTNLISPTSPPSIDPSFLSTDFDIFTLKEAVKSVRRLVAVHAWDGYIVGPAPPPPANTSMDAELEEFVRAGASSVFHPTGTAAMSPKGAQWGVVDPDLKVKGVEGLRIVDGSVLPFPPNAHTQGPIYLVGERGADLIKADHAI